MLLRKKGFFERLALGAVGRQKAKQPCQGYLCRGCKCAARIANQPFTAPSRPLDTQGAVHRGEERTRCGLVRGALSLSHECAMTIAARKRDSNTRRGARVHDEPERRSSARGTMRRGAQNKCCNGLVHDLFFLSIPATSAEKVSKPTQFRPQLQNP